MATNDNDKSGIISPDDVNLAKTFIPGQYAAETDFMYQSMGGGGFNNQFQTFFTAFDRYQRNQLAPNNEHSGITLITRPRLCLTGSNLRQSQVMAPLETLNPTSIAFGIRCLLDTKFCEDHIQYVDKSPWISRNNPFFLPLCNGLTSVNGWPDQVIQTATSDGGFFSEDQTVAIGGDDLNKTYDLTFNFKDPQGGWLSSIFQYWGEYIRCVCRGDMVAYKEHIDAQRLDYTVSVYRFILDPSRRFITKYAKATGCFPRVGVIGSMYNVEENETMVSASGRFSIPFVVNKIEYRKLAIMQDFRLLVQRYEPNIESYPVLNMCPFHNFVGMPWIQPGSNGMELVFRDVPNMAMQSNNQFNPDTGHHRTPAGTVIPCLYNNTK